MIIKQVYTKDTTAGTVSWNTEDDMRGCMESIVINPSSASTTYDFNMTDDQGNVIYNKTGLMGTYVDDSKVGVYGKYTCKIDNASSNSYSWTVVLLWNEKLVTG